MPPPSSSGPVLRWPSSAEVLEQAHQWAQRQAAGHAELEAVGVFGSYGRGDAGVGSLQGWLIPPAGADGGAGADPVKGGNHR